MQTGLDISADPIYNPPGLQPHLSFQTTEVFLYGKSSHWVCDEIGLHYFCNYMG